MLLQGGEPKADQHCVLGGFSFVGFCVGRPPKSAQGLDVLLPIPQRLLPKPSLMRKKAVTNVVHASCLEASNSTTKATRPAPTEVRAGATTRHGWKCTSKMHFLPRGLSEGGAEDTRPFRELKAGDRRGCTRGCAPVRPF